MRPTDPKQLMGVYTEYQDIPDYYRLYHYSDQFDGRDVWSEFVAQKDISDYESRRFRRVEKSWKNHVESHHALAHPDEVEDYFSDMMESKSLTTTYFYFQRLHGFYKFLMMNYNYPHVYSPVMLAVVSGPETRKCWDYKISERKRVQ
ncbi:hypothetical protein [Haloterrigena salinisoli]|uniref:hypothetical protein n=1 Tax=Haloterrigena salinisoli TaxID=3132747 RepID=UPI0030D18E44